MNEHRGEKRFLYVTPFLSEVDRICMKCDFDQPDTQMGSKSRTLKQYLETGANIAATHSLFYLLDDEAKELLRQMNYSLIIDETMSVVEDVRVTQYDYDMLMKTCLARRGGRKLVWTRWEYDGAFNVIRDLARAGSLYDAGGSFLKMVDPEVFRVCPETFMLTYMFKGQYQSAYLDYFGFNYNVVGIEEDEEGFYFSDRPDDPPPIDYASMIHILDEPKLNEIGADRYALSMAWYGKRSRKNPDIIALRKHMTNYFMHKCPHREAGTRMWTCFKAHGDKLVSKNGRYKDDFVQISSRATNDYQSRDCLAYMANRFADPNIRKFFGSKDIALDDNMFALSEMLQWIWRSAIRNDKEIWLYIPSSRMRAILKHWIAEVSSS